MSEMSKTVYLCVVTVLSIIFLYSCENGNADEINDIKRRLDLIENSEIVSLKTQILSMNGAIGGIQNNLDSNDGDIQAISDAISEIRTTIKGLVTDEEYRVYKEVNDGEIKRIFEFLDSKISLEEFESLKEKHSSDMADLIYSLEGLVTQDDFDSLDCYYRKALLAIREDVRNLQNDVNLRGDEYQVYLEEYKKEVANAQMEMKSRILELENVADSLSTSLKIIDGLVDNLSTKVTSLETMVTALQKCVAVMLQSIKSIVYVPEYSDGVSVVNRLQEPFTLKYDVRPKSSAVKVEEAFRKGKINIEYAIRQVETRSAQPSITIDSVKGLSSGELYVVSRLDGMSAGQKIAVSLSMESEAYDIQSPYVIVDYKPLLDYNIEIVGPGFVDVDIVKSRTSVEYGSTIHLHAYPYTGIVHNAKFKGWGGDLSGTDADVDVMVTDSTKIVAFFGIDPVPLPNLSQCSRKYQRVYPDISYYTCGVNPVNSCTLDYNRDGYPDIISMDTKYVKGDRQPLRFLLGKEDGDFVLDAKNDNRMLGLEHPRKAIWGDYNNDGFPDLCLLGHGYDAPPYYGEPFIILMSDASSGKYDYMYFDDYVGFWHGGASADVDNDGDLDIFLIQAWIGDALLLINDGNGNFTVCKDRINQSDDFKGQMYNAELYDIDKDGNVDLIIGGHDHHNYSISDKYVNMPVVIWGDGSGYFLGDYTRLPETPVKGMGIVTDFYFYDLDDDGVEELIISRTSDGYVNPSIVSYYGWCVQVLKRYGRSFRDATGEFIGLSRCCSSAEDWTWKVWLEIKDGHLFGLGNSCVAEKMFGLDNGHLVRCE